MDTGTCVYSLLDGDRDETKKNYLLDLGIGMRMTFFFGNEYGITKLVSHIIVIPKKK